MTVKITRMLRMKKKKKEKKKKSMVEDVARKRAGLRKTAGKRKLMIRKKIQAQEVQDELHAPPQHQARNEHRWCEYSILFTAVIILKLIFIRNNCWYVTWDIFIVILVVSYTSGKK